MPDAAVTVLVVLAGMGALFGLGYWWGQPRAIVIAAVMYSVPWFAADLLFITGAIDYCAQPDCDQLNPLAWGLLALPCFVAPIAAGVLVRRRSLRGR